MKSENLNIDAELDSLGDFDSIVPEENFSINVLDKLNNYRTKNRQTYIRLYIFIFMMIITNLISFVSLFDHQSQSERTSRLGLVINSFLLDR